MYWYCISQKWNYEIHWDTILTHVWSHWSKPVWLDSYIGKTTRSLCILGCERVAASQFNISTMISFAYETRSGKSFTYYRTSFNIFWRFLNGSWIGIILSRAFLLQIFKWLSGGSLRLGLRNARYPMALRSWMWGLLHGVVSWCLNMAGVQRSTLNLFFEILSISEMSIYEPHLGRLFRADWYFFQFFHMFFVVGFLWVSYFWVNCTSVFHMLDACTK